MTTDGGTGTPGIGVPAEHLRVAKVVGENDDGLTLFVPKDMTGSFHVEDGDRFLTMIFVRQEERVDHPAMATWLPWDGH